MKAKEYLAKLRQLEAKSDFDNAVGEMFVAMSSEAADIMKLRRCQRDSAVLAVIEEMNGRWNAVAKQEPRVRRNGFKELWEKRLKALPPQGKEAAKGTEDGSGKDI